MPVGPSLLKSVIVGHGSERPASSHAWPAAATAASLVLGLLQQSGVRPSPAVAVRTVHHPLGTRRFQRRAEAKSALFRMRTSGSRHPASVMGGYAGWLSAVSDPLVSSAGILYTECQFHNQTTDGVRLFVCHFF